MNTIPGPAPGAMGDDDIHAFPRATVAPVAATPRTGPRRRWPQWLLGLSLLGLLLSLLAAVLVGQAVQGPHGLAGLFGPGDWRIGWHEDGWHGDLGFGTVLAIVTALAVSLLVVVVVVPLVLLGTGLVLGVSLALAALAVVVSLALVLGAAALALLLATSPLWLIGLALWWALKPRRPVVASAASA